MAKNMHQTPVNSNVTHLPLKKAM